MNKLILSLAVALALAGSDVVPADPDDGPPRDHYGLFQAGDGPVFPDYDTGVKWARADKRPLVLFVGVEPRQIPGCVVCRQDYGLSLQRGVYVSWFGPAGHTAERPFRAAPTDRQVYASLLAYGQTPPRELLCKCGLACPHGDGCRCGRGCGCSPRPAPPVFVPPDPGAACPPSG